MTHQHLTTDHEQNDHPMNFLLNEDFNLPEAGEIRTGWVVEHRNNEILVDIGAKSEGIIPSREVSLFDEETLATLAVGNEVRVYIVNPGDENGNILLSYTKIVEEQDWIRADELLANQETFESKIVGYNRGGLLVKLGQIRGFIPKSQLSRDYQFNDKNPASMRKLIGQTIYAKVIEVDRQRNRLILSEKEAEKELRDVKRAQILSELKEGDVCEGRVINLADFGAFVDIGGVEGLIHLSELSWKRVNKPEDVLQVGDSIKVYVLNIDQDRQRLALSLKRLQPDPWTTIDEIYREGQLIEATVTKLTKFGAFARLNDEYELEGLIHISELSEDHVNHPNEVVKPSQVVTVRIIRIDPEQRQLGLSLKQVASDKYLETDLQMLSS
ncbi:MAG: S1 RNA-binding domain-containing protein [Chloroflexi bacterium]|nr:MAG: S1 RNA-binding domain-containing protein [Chloroflexota bacterium]